MTLHVTQFQDSAAVNQECEASTATSQTLAPTSHSMMRCSTNQPVVAATPSVISLMQTASSLGVNSTDVEKVQQLSLPPSTGPTSCNPLYPGEHQPHPQSLIYHTKSLPKRPGYASETS